MLKILLKVAACVAFVLVANGALQWFLNKSKDVAMERLSKNMKQMQKDQPTKVDRKP